ncbi:hypothetical protein [Lentzea atacamensis]|uniref:hypothetical protein n=1 Tax=Lentzea atacamensis TaxID=531938 RepID=UPI001475A825|nr:hypothetical protein [Lentzea atacamensis]
MPDHRVVAEIPRAQIADVQSGQSLRVVLVDGSGFELLLDPPGRDRDRGRDRGRGRDEGTDEVLAAAR